jgi:hypothetical protein
MLIELSQAPLELEYVKFDATSSSVVLTNVVLNSKVHECEDVSLEKHARSVAVAEGEYGRAEGEGRRRALISEDDLVRPPSQAILREELIA